MTMKLFFAPVCYICILILQRRSCCKFVRE